MWCKVNERDARERHNNETRNDTKDWKQEQDYNKRTMYGILPARPVSRYPYALAFASVARALALGFKLLHKPKSNTLTSPRCGIDDEEEK
jgi:acyl-CoA reductase-like NAD-dependent aldehyde dehydrogenase